MIEPDAVLVVSEVWRDTLRAQYDVDAMVVHNGVETERFAPIAPSRRAELRSRVGAGDRFLFLAVGGVEPRKGSVYLFEALARLRRRMEPAPLLAVIGGHSFQDYARYRDLALGRLDGLGLTLGRDVVLLGTVPEAEMPAWYRAADALAFPSTKEGFGLAILEAMSADLPVVASDLPVFQEYLVPGQDALMPPVGNVAALAEALRAVATDSSLRGRLVRAGRRVAARFTWQACAEEHRAVYSRFQRKADGLPATCSSESYFGRAARYEPINPPT